jgi:hypothetical protein
MPTNCAIQDTEYGTLNPDLYAARQPHTSSFSLFLSRLELSDTKVCAPQIRALLGTAENKWAASTTPAAHLQYKSDYQWVFPNSQILNPNPSTLNPKHQTLNRKPYTLTSFDEHRPQLQQISHDEPKPQIPSLKPPTNIFKPQTL